MEQGECFLNDLVVGDEAAFCLNGSVNTQNVREYAPIRHPPSFHYDKSRLREKWTVWAALCGNGSIIGPIFVQGNMNGERYLEMLINDIFPQLRNEFGDRFDQLRWIQDGAPPHRRIIVRDHLKEVFNNRVIALGHDREWPPRSPDLTPCDFFLWGYIKSQVFNKPPCDLNELRNRITHAFDQLKQNRQMIINSVAAMRRQAQLCVTRHGEHVEGRG